MVEHSSAVGPAADAGRYSLLRPLGEGASGSVYLALDSETGEQVALKKLFRVDQRSVQRFKREFRSLTDLHHPNLVKLFDLQRGSDAWFLTMEYVEGVDLHSHLSGGHDSRATLDSTADTHIDLASTLLGRLLPAFHELASGIRALHRAGLLHRDLKPSNVLVALDGRVVVLDFGLIRSLEAHSVNVTLDGTVAGTPAYMPPEQALGQKLTEASDWYAFGVMLYEALAGALPFDGGSVVRLLERKLNLDPPTLSHERLGVPRELAELCMQLLRRPPGERPSGNRVLEVFAALRGEPLSQEITQPDEVSILAELEPAPDRKRAALIGRDAALSQLEKILDLARAGESVAVSVRGGSGAGKTALIERFLYDVQHEEVSGGPRPLILRSRCYEREAMPFKALDGAMDGLVHFLAMQDDVRGAFLLPSGLAELTQLFPTFQRLRAVQHLLLTERPHPDAAHTRRRAEQSLRALLDRVASQQPVILWIDDLQWGDLDSASVLSEWFGQPSSTPLMLVLSYRSEELQTSACLLALNSSLLATESGSRALIELDALGDGDVQTLCAQRMPAGVPAEVVTRIVAEARGNPFLVLQLTALAQAKLARKELDLDDISISELVLRSSELLPEGARAILKVLAIAGRPLVPHLALRAANVGASGRTLIHSLQGLRLLRSRVMDGERFLEIYHDRVREAVHAALGSAERQSIHDRLLRVMEISGRADVDWLHELALGARELALALRYGIAAAERASKSLAFERAIDLYQRCLRLAQTKSEQTELWGKLAAVLARSRRGAEAADAYLEAAERVDALEKLPLLQLAASHLLRSGRFEEGERLVQRVLEMQGIEVPTSDVGLYAAIGWERTRLALGGSNFQLRKSRVEGISSELARIGELYGVLSVETQFYAPLRAALFQARAMRFGLKSGDPLLVARALCLTATMSCISGTPRAAQRANEQLAQAEALTATLENQDVRAELFTARTVCAFLLGEMNNVLAASDLADHIYDTQRTGGAQGDYYYLFAVTCTRLGALQVLGHYARAEPELRELVARAEATANRTALLQATMARTMSDMAQDRAAQSRPRLDREREELPRDGIGVLHYLHLSAVMRLACATSEFDWALEVMDRYWEPCIRSPLRHGRVLRYFLHSSRAKFLLNRYVALGRNGDPAAVVREDMRALSGIRLLRLSDPSRNFRARIAYLRGDVAKATQMIHESSDEFATLGVLEEAARERYALGCLIPGEEGARMRDAAHAASVALGVVNPLALFRASHPELAIDNGI